MVGLNVFEFGLILFFGFVLMGLLGLIMGCVYDVCGMWLLLIFGMIFVFVLLFFYLMVGEYIVWWVLIIV